MPDGQAVVNDADDPTSTVERAIIGVAVRSLLKIVGTALVTRGLTDQGTVDGIMATLVEAIVGATMIGAGSAWSVVRVLFEHSRWAKRWQALLSAANGPAGKP